jgi:macrolide transport system ATP-binding/permease protein
MYDAVKDLRFAIRQLQRAPGFAFTAVFVLAIGTCANLAIFAFVDAALIRPLPYKDSSRLVSVFVRTPTAPRAPVSYLDYRDWKSMSKDLGSLEAFGGSGGYSFALRTSSGSERVKGMKVTDGFFQTLGVSPALGRAFHSGEDSPGAPEAIILSYGTWQKRFGSSADVLGQTVTLDDIPRTIVGVLPRDFHFAPAGPAEFWATLRGTNPCEKNRACHSVFTIARLNDGLSAQAAQSEMTGIAKQLQRQYPDSNRDIDAGVVYLWNVILAGVRPILLVLLAGSGLLFLIACINVVSLLFARTDGRHREIAIRRAVGASVARLVRQFAAEGLVLTAAGCILGLLIAEWGIRFLSRLIPAEMADSMPYLSNLGLNSHVVIFASAASLLAAVFFSLAPVLRAPINETGEGLNEGSRGSSGTTWRRFGAQLVIAELAIAVVLLVGAGLLGKSLYQLLRVDVGVNAAGLATMQVEAPALRYVTNEQIVALKREIVRRISASPGVQSVGISDQLPLSAWGGTGVWFDIVGQPSENKRKEASNRHVSSAYFTTLQSRVLFGRNFTEAEESSKVPVVIINRSLKERYFGTGNPVGQQIFYSTPPQPPMQIIGVVQDIKEGPPDAPPQPALYVPFDQSPNNPFGIVVRTARAEEGVFRGVVATLRQIEPGLLIHDQLTMRERINQSPSAYLHRSSAWLVGSFAAVAFLLGIVGLYGVIAYSVGKRTREIGLRIALGAEPRSVYLLIVREGAALALAGIAIGSVLSLLIGSWIRAMLFDVAPWDPATFGVVAAAVAIAALVACFVPARHAASVDPIEALRME